MLTGPQVILVLKIAVLAVTLTAVWLLCAGLTYLLSTQLLPHSPGIQRHVTVDWLDTNQIGYNLTASLRGRQTTTPEPKPVLEGRSDYSFHGGGLLWVLLLVAVCLLLGALARRAWIASASMFATTMITVVSMIMPCSNS